MSDPGGALAGTRVLDLIDGMAAYGPKLLAGLGADVIRVEPPTGSAQRHRQSLWREAPSEDTAGLYFVHYNAGKRGITLDPTTLRGASLLRSLLDQVDIVFDNGELARWGFDLAALAEKSPPLVVVSVTPFGLDGERASWLGSDLICQAMSGMIQIYGHHDERPARFGPEQASEMGGLAAALGALIALFNARRTGEGELVDIAVERVCALVSFQMSNASLFHQFGFKRSRGPASEGLPNGLYQASDGYVALSAWRDPDETIAMLDELGCAGELRSLRASLAHEAFIADPRVNAIFTDFAAQHSRAELVELMQAHGLLGLPVHDVRDLVNDPFLQQRALFVDVEQAGLDRALLDVGPPIRFGRTPFAPGRRPPLLGEHNAAVYGDLGVDAATLGALAREGVI